jgi:hypothetical protein
MLYQSTSVGFGYGLWRRRCFPEVLRRPPNPLRENDLRPSSRSAGGGILTPFPSAAAFALALGARLTLRGMTLRRNPWTFGVRGSHPHLRYSCQHSHFRCLHKGSRPCFAGLRNAPLPRSEDRDQRSEIRIAAMEAGEHAGDFLILAPPTIRRPLVGIAEIPAIDRPHLHLVRRAQRHRHEPAKLRFRDKLPAETFGQIGADRFGRPPDLIGQRPLLDRRKLEACPMHPGLRRGRLSSDTR